jgi:hypothetical protein
VLNCRISGIERGKELSSRCILHRLFLFIFIPKFIFHNIRYTMVYVNSKLRYAIAYLEKTRQLLISGRVSKVVLTEIFLVVG